MAITSTKRLRADIPEAVKNMKRKYGTSMMGMWMQKMRWIDSNNQGHGSVASGAESRPVKQHAG
jgi:hypothetical protein